MSGTEVLDPLYGQLFDQACDALGAGIRVRVLELTGAVTSGTADRQSDLIRTWSRIQPATRPEDEKGSFERRPLDA